MNLKTLSTTVATAAFVGAIGLAYAQTSTDPATAAPPAPAPDTTMQRQAPGSISPAPTGPATAPSDMRTAPRDTGTVTTPAGPRDGPMSAPAPQADRG